MPGQAFLLRFVEVWALSVCEVLVLGALRSIRVSLGADPFNHIVLRQRELILRGDSKLDLQTLGLKPIHVSTHALIGSASGSRDLKLTTC